MPTAKKINQKIVLRSAKTGRFISATTFKKADQAKVTKERVPLHSKK